MLLNLQLGESGWPILPPSLSSPLTHIRHFCLPHSKRFSKPLFPGALLQNPGKPPALDISHILSDLFSGRFFSSQIRGNFRSIDPKGFGKKRVGFSSSPTHPPPSLEKGELAATYFYPTASQKQVSRANNLYGQILVGSTTKKNWGQNTAYINPCKHVGRTRSQWILGAGWL